MQRAAELTSFTLLRSSFFFHEKQAALAAWAEITTSGLSHLQFETACNIIGQWFKALGDVLDLAFVFTTRHNWFNKTLKAKISYEILFVVIPPWAHVNLPHMFVVLSLIRT